MWIISGFGTGLGGIQGEFSVLLFIFTHTYSNNLAGLDYKPHRQVYKRIMMDVNIINRGTNRLGGMWYYPNIV